MATHVWHGTPRVHPTSSRLDITASSGSRTAVVGTGLLLLAGSLCLLTRWPRVGASFIFAGMPGPWPTWLGHHPAATEEG